MKKFAVLIALILFSMEGCVYYNTFFNAERYFEEAQEMALNDEGYPSNAAIQNYNKTIKKCGIVLTEYKDSEYSDDALFLMGRCFFYIGRNYTQAIKNFDDLIEFYPDSKFVPKAKIYIARCNYQFGQKQKAFDLLQEFLQEPLYSDEHPQALQLLADYHLADMNFVEADYYLQRIIEKYPKSDQYENAFFLKGKAQYEAGNYAASIEVFNSLLKSRVQRNMKLDARYYIALNYILLEDYEKAYKYSLSLLKDDYRENNISKIQLLKARSMSGLEDNEAAIPLFELIMTDNKRTQLSAEAAYFLGDLYFSNLHDYEKAIEYFNKVNTENNKSKYVEKAVTRSAVASQIIQFNNPDTSLNTKELVSQQFKLAEYYIEELNMPDSALFVYDYIIKHKDLLVAKLDSLQIRLNYEKNLLDSLNLVAEATPSEMEDAEIISESVNIEKDKAIDDSLWAEVELPDSIELVQVTDSMNSPFEIPAEEKKDESIASASADSLETTIVTVADSTQVIAPSLQEKLNQQNSIVASLQQYIDRTSRDISEYQDEFIPFAEFVKIWLYKTVYSDSTRVATAFEDFSSRYPDHKYSYASRQLIDGDKVEITTLKEKNELKSYENALALISTAPDSADVLLKSIAADSLNSFNMKARYCLGYLNHFVLQDTLKAKDYYDNILALDTSNEYKTSIEKYYDGNHFLAISRLPVLVQIEERERLEEEEEAQKAILEKVEEVETDIPSPEKDKSKKLKKEEPASSTKDKKSPEKEQIEKLYYPELLKDEISEPAPPDSTELQKQKKQEEPQEKTQEEPAEPEIKPDKTTEKSEEISEESAEEITPTEEPADSTQTQKATKTTKKGTTEETSGNDDETSSASGN
ncbi:MAG TPA: tetratricopeptide repeat protein [Candidatus Cloacimonadota bacterium]|nr:tetratricopeptide repeat protein [Candidatus Cloacimonadota bacterium]